MDSKMIKDYMKKYDLDADGLSTIKPTQLKSTDDKEDQELTQMKAKLDTNLHVQSKNPLLEKLFLSEDGSIQKEVILKLLSQMPNV